MSLENLDRLFMAIYDWESEGPQDDTLPHIRHYLAEAKKQFPFLREFSIPEEGDPKEALCRIEKAMLAHVESLGS